MRFVILYQLLLQRLGIQLNYQYIPYLDDLKLRPQTTVTTTQPPSPSPYSCSPDIAILFDGSRALSENDFTDVGKYLN